MPDDSLPPSTTRDADDSQRVMLVTGGARGIGAEIARAGVARGYRVAVTYSTSEIEATDLVNFAGVHAAIRSDAGEEADVVAAVAEV
ncbi:MAG TPA: SDR family NAD(P)-dependent oxidoreductase, partial [Ilumatobacteraceae bacterium]|nr:SDR family NAD(P)-dependent oxidoreductase [Ilumatobacteraceae bacterium]